MQPTPKSKPINRSSINKAATTSTPSRPTSRRSTPPCKTCLKNRPFPPRPTPRTRALKREHNRGRLEIRCVHCLEVTPSQAGFPGARLAARLETRVKRGGKWCREVVFLISSLTLEQLQARGLLQFKRRY